MPSTLPRIRPVLFLLLFAALAPAIAPAQDNAPAGKQSAGVTLLPSVVESGSPELITVNAPMLTPIHASQGDLDSPNIANLRGEWLGHELRFSPARNHRTWFVLAGVDVETPPGPSTLKITYDVTTGQQVQHRHIEIDIPIHAAHYRTGTLTVSPKFVEPDPEALKQIEAERKLKEKAFSTSADQLLWSGSFRAPVKTGIQMTDSFGTRRTFNGKLASIHKGADFRAPMGTPVLAGNSGTVLLAQPLYYEGNCVILDHGLGLISISMHLSRIDVKPGQQVARGQQLGLSGATGRVTGPHLHWAIRWQGAMLDPAKLLDLHLDPLH